MRISRAEREDAVEDWEVGEVRVILICIIYKKGKKMHYGYYATRRKHD
jgi:hypothetical protein